jgi:hypothetical protein
MATTINDETTTCTPDLQPLWHHKAPRVLVENCPGEDFVRGWKTWQDHLRKRNKPVAPPFLKKKNSPLLWGWPSEWERAAIVESIQSPTALAEVVIGDDPAASPDMAIVLQTVALAYAMPKLAREMPAESWWQLLERLREIATQAQTNDVDWPGDPQAVLRQQLLAGELPLALGYLFPEVRAMRALRSEASETLSEAICALTDGRGLPDARLLPVLGPLFACWTRVTWLSSQTKKSAWSREADLQYQWLVRHAIRLADKDGRFVLTNSPADTSGAQPKHEAWNNDMFALAIRLAGDRADVTAASIALPRGVLCKKLKPDPTKLPRPSLNSDWAGITVMADGWSQSDTRLAASYVAAQMNIEFSVFGEKFMVGLWDFETHCDGKLAHPTGDWEQLCWERGDLYNLLELGRPLSEGLRLERQLLFGVKDHVIYLADSITSRDGSAHTIRHSMDLPLADKIQWQPEGETRDGILAGEKIRAAVMPAGLSEWRADPRGGTIESRGGRLILTQETRGRALCCPLVIDLDRRRTKDERTWRQLTVGENLDIVSSDVAVGYRAQSGDGQWLFYRSLGPAGNRTVLGVNISGEFTAGRFPSSGKFKQWIEIEAV